MLLKLSEEEFDFGVREHYQVQEETSREGRRCEMTDEGARGERCGTNLKRWVKVLNSSIAGVHIVGTITNSLKF